MDYVGFTPVKHDIQGNVLLLYIEAQYLDKLDKVFKGTDMSPVFGTQKVNRNWGFAPNNRSIIKYTKPVYNSSLCRFGFIQDTYPSRTKVRKQAEILELIIVSKFI